MKSRCELSIRNRKKWPQCRPAQLWPVWTTEPRNTLSCTHKDHPRSKAGPTRTIQGHPKDPTTHPPCGSSRTPGREVTCQPWERTDRREGALQPLGLEGASLDSPAQPSYNRNRQGSRGFLMQKSWIFNATVYFYIVLKLIVFNWLVTFFTTQFIG